MINYATLVNSLCALGLFVALRMQVASCYIVPNTLRYAQGDQVAQYAEQVANIYQASGPTMVNNYRINRDLKQAANEHELDAEDLTLLSKFYQETREQNPFLDESFTTQSLWDGAQDKELTSALIDSHRKPTRFEDESPESLQPHKQEAAHTTVGRDWTIDTSLIEQAEKLSNGLYVDDPSSLIAKPAGYSPQIKLLTLYNPLENLDQIGGKMPGNRVVGATLFGKNEHSKPGIESKSPVEAIKLHDELLQEPPKDGKVRVRMYFHRARHDDIKLYGTGPWKYWGHGWGVEFGYDPKKGSNRDFYQKGYTIERAFGRDFCLDQKNCRPPDREFFKTYEGVSKL